MIDVPGGEFVMGSDAGLPDQRPAHPVRVRPFRMAVHAVTREEYRAFLDDTGTPPPPTWSSPLFANPRQPAVGVNWLEAFASAEWLSKLTGRRLRRRAEAERERATRGLVEGRPYPWGDSPSPDGRPVSVMSAPAPVDDAFPNPLGIKGLADGVHEWCLDWYAPEWYAASPADDPVGPTDGTRRVSRGGSWRHHVATTPCATRSSLPPHLHYTDYGLRLVEPL
jgi:formylglycine-generating enzyme required for sulfatase activity